MRRNENTPRSKLRWDGTELSRWWPNSKSLRSRGLLLLWSQVRAMWLLIWWPLEAYMIVNFKTCGISQVDPNNYVKLKKQRWDGTVTVRSVNCKDSYFRDIACFSLLIIKKYISKVKSKDNPSPRKVELFFPSKTCQPLLHSFSSRKR